MGARFTIGRIAERYRLKEKTVVRVVAEFRENYFLKVAGLTSVRRKVIDKDTAVEMRKATAFASACGWDQMGDGEPDVGEDTPEFKGWRQAQDWVRRQNVEVEMMQAYPLPYKRNPVPKRVDVDRVVGQTPTTRIISWLDPTDKVII